MIQHQNWQAEAKTSGANKRSQLIQAVDRGQTFAK